MSDAPSPPDTPAPPIDPPAAPSTPRATWHNWAGAALGLVILGLAVWGITTIAGQVTIADVLADIRATPPHLFVAAALSAATSYVFLIGYDWFATRHLGYRLPWPTLAAASFASFTMSHTLGLTVVTGGAVRYRIYSRAAVKPADIAMIVVMCGWTFWLGVVTVAGTGLVANPDLARPVAEHLPTALAGAFERWLGPVMLGGVLLWVLTAALWRRPIKLWRYRFALPDGGSTLVQIGIGIIDLAFAGGALFLLLPDAGPGLLGVLTIYGVAMVSGALAHAPGGLGVFELVVVALLPESPKAGVLAALVMFRIVYTYVPFLLGVAVLLIGEARAVRRARGAAPPTPAIAE